MYKIEDILNKSEYICCVGDSNIMVKSIPSIILKRRSLPAGVFEYEAIKFDDIRIIVDNLDSKYNNYRAEKWNVYNVFITNPDTNKMALGCVLLTWGYKEPSQQGIETISYPEAKEPTKEEILTMLYFI